MPLLWHLGFVLSWAHGALGCCSVDYWHPVIHPGFFSNNLIKIIPVLCLSIFLFVRIIIIETNHDQSRHPRSQGQVMLEGYSTYINMFPTMVKRVERSVEIQRRVFPATLWYNNHLSLCNYDIIVILEYEDICIYKCDKVITCSQTDKQTKQTRKTN